MGGKWLELLSEIAPGLKQATIMFNPDTAIVSTFMPSFETAARSLKVVLITAPVHSEVEIETAIIALGAIVGEASMADSMEDWPPPAAITTFADGDPAENGWVSDAPSVELIEIAAYSPEWPVLFEASKELIAQALPGVALNIEHVGSTAVPNLAAKPIIDMDLIVDDPTREETYVPALAALGYVLTIRERTWYEHRMLRHDRPRINLHVFGRNCPEHARHILFRDWLRTHPEDCARYTRVKDEARIGVTNVRDYNRNKEAVVRDIYATIFDSRGWGAV